jgi:hypothetical protein
MALVLNGSGSITGLSAGGLPDGSVTADDIASTLDLSGKTITNMNPSGIYLGGTGAANYLDDYEEGTWTPTVIHQSAPTGGVTYSLQDGMYTKIGNIVTGYFQITCTISGTVANAQIYIGALPFTASASIASDGFGPFPMKLRNATGSVTAYPPFAFLITKNATSFWITDWTGSGNRADEVGTGTNVQFQGVFVYATDS